MANGENPPSCVGLFALLDYDRLEGQHTLMDLKKTPDVAYEDVFRKFDKVWCVQSLIVTCNNLVVTWKLGPRWALFLEFPRFVKFPRYYSFSLQFVPIFFLINASPLRLYYQYFMAYPSLHN